ncbi:hypothetical protein R1flu_014803, partial [Riccia fluitans]
MTWERVEGGRREGEKGAVRSDRGSNMWLLGRNKYRGQRRKIAWVPRTGSAQGNP